jgi:hypothetical protein
MDITDGLVQLAIAILGKFYTELSTDTERWNFVEDYFLGRDVLNDTID